MAKGPANPERSFGLSVGGVLCVVAAFLAWRHRIGRAEAVGAIGGALVFFGAVRPRLLKYPSALWWRFARTLGYINARVLFTLLFAIVLTPLAFLWRLTGKDPLARKRQSWTGWSTYPARYRDKSHYRRMF